MRRNLWNVCLVLVLLSAVTTSLGFMPGQGKKEKAPAVKSDIKYIKCSVCEELTKNIHRDVKKMRDELGSGKKVKEIDIIEKIETMCDPDKPAGDWITHLDMMEEGKKIKLVEHERPGKCQKECRTIAKACEEVMGDTDTDIAEALYKGDMQRSKLQNLLCRELSGVCEKKPPAVPKSRKPIEDFVELTDKEIEMQELMASMGDMPGMPGMDMYSRDDLDSMMEEYGDYSGDYDQDGFAEEDDELVPPLREEPDVGIVEKVAGGVDTVVEEVAKGIVYVGEKAGEALNWASDYISGKKGMSSDSGKEL